MLILTCSGRAWTQQRVPPAAEGRIDSLLAVMTLEEKLGQLNQLSGPWRDTLSVELKAMISRGEVGSLLNVVGAEGTREAQEIVLKESRLRIPLLFGLDVIHGFRTIFPIPLAEAATWDVAAVERAARVSALEATAAGIHWTFAPMVDIARDPRWGRIAEGSGEDPHLGAVMAVARVRGFQGTDLQAPDALLACAKHFAAYGGAEGGRDYNTVDLSERTLREIYLRPFQAAVAAGAGSLMSAFNEIGGVPSSANHWLLTKVLREEWHFNGFVVSDWNAIGELLAHGVAANRAAAGALALQAGVDMDMESRIYLQDLAPLVREKRLPEDFINQAVRRVLQAKQRLGLFGDPFRGSSKAREQAMLLHPGHIALARELAQKAIVLLKNEKNLLPLRRDMRTLAVLGPLADDRSAPLGPWHCDGKPEDVVTVLQGIKAAVSPGTKVLHARGCPVDSHDTRGFAAARRLALQAEAVILVVGENEEMSGEAASRAHLQLPGVQEEFVRLIHATGKPVIVVLMNGRPLTVPWLAEQVPALVESWFLGVQHGHAVADVLFGAVNPSGKLPVTFPRSEGQIPLYYNFKQTGRPPGEDKYTSKYLDFTSTPLFPFGYGLSYTTFTYSNLRLSAAKIRRQDSLRVSVEIQNTGSRSGEEIVQLYVRDEVGSVTRPVKELKDFRRVALAAGESKTVAFVLHPMQLAFYNLDMKWTPEPGTFKVFVGKNSNEVLEARFELVE
ncbi:MAG: glycoside hydrolase family 3 C-terminal domain-containing protein [candidate division KSB1 bacterium]|nr:glycoside hydrolase family 3 C-terminal domain-containing protein [candidate division KSB1 bacterium]MDZ7287170.1 glycoside hydrolase family 3 C-terminal domain-containing protein [candidate division KSB1 bacterium]MDZ7296905.1 glycoside hydrolase family 3 C-terminal domain-containing protein [candidate division KSB1 bacterium]MDZ7309495.1 glycoside hydrolase family 3 C-terminal domain-containing protein [candidate division KSB1 bacterium]MDZ7347772.1 glycoside hydrolase family 3 C-terminal 